jgi:hypothetical protein
MTAQHTSYQSRDLPIARARYYIIIQNRGAPSLPLILHALVSPLCNCDAHCITTHQRKKERNSNEWKK